MRSLIRLVSLSQQSPAFPRRDVLVIYDPTQHFTTNQRTRRSELERNRVKSGGGGGVGRRHAALGIE